jgi:hypothetical protein
MLNWLGIQDTARKRRDPCRDPGPWAGSVVQVAETGIITVSVTQERWDKTVSIIKWIREAMDAEDGFEFKTLERYRGFLVHVARTYPVMTAYLKGIHLTLDSWRPGRGDDGWKLTRAEREAMLEDDPVTLPADQNTPKFVKSVPRLKGDIEALTLFTQTSLPPSRMVRPAENSSVAYVFGDASGSGFGSTWYDGKEVSYSSGQWSEQYSAQTSNFRELANLVIMLEQAHERGELRNSKVFIFTDNGTAESAFFRGTSSSKVLFELILRLQFIHMHGGVIVHFVHVAGKRMISQGTDRLSRGSCEGVPSGDDFLQYVPLHQSALERQPIELQEWVGSWFNGTGPAKWLTPNDWFGSGHSEDFSVWAPAPGAADAALEQLAKAVHKRPQMTRLVIIPRLMTALWRKLLHKICDVVFNVPLGASCWPDSQCEPLIVGLSLPLSRHPPWKLGGTKLLVKLERDLHGLPENDFGRSRFVLWKLLVQTRELERLPASVVREML